MTYNISNNACIKNFTPKDHKLKKTISIYKIPYTWDPDRKDKNNKEFNQTFTDSSGIDFQVNFESLEKTLLKTGFSIKLFDELKYSTNGSLCEYFSAFPFSESDLSKLITKIKHYIVILFTNI